MEYVKILVDEEKKKFEEKYPSLNIWDESGERLSFLEKIDKYLTKRYEENPKDIDIVSTLSATRLLLTYDESYYADILKNFLEENKDSLSDNDKARILTNLAFYYEDREEAEEYLLKAERLNSIYPETYRGLALNYFNKYKWSKEQESVRKSLRNFERARELSNEYNIEYSYGVLLFENKEYSQAKSIFEKLLENYPNRMRLLVALAYCEVHLENKDKVGECLRKIKIGQDVTYKSSHTDEIYESEVWDLYYFVEDYDKFLELCYGNINSYFALEFEHYFYVLWLKGKKEEFNTLVNKFKGQTKKNIEDIEKEDTYSDGEKTEIIGDLEEDLRNIDILVDKIVKKNYKPKVKFSLSPEYGCYLIDCLIHKF